MSPRTLVQSGRQLAATLLRDTGRIARVDTTPTFDPNTGTYTPDTGTTIHEGPCRVRTASLSALGFATSPVFGEASVTLSRFSITFPWDIPAVQVGDIITITASEDDPHLTTRAFRVTAVPSATDLMYRELGVEVVE